MSKTGIRISDFVDSLLNSWPIENDGEEQVVWQTLHDLLMAWSRFEMMSDRHKALTTALCKKLQHHFDTKCTLKERKTKRKKENFPPNPLIKEKQEKEKEEKHLSLVCDAKSAFREECLSYVGQYDTQQLTDFYNWWSEENPKTGKMRFQDMRYWNTKKRLERWVKNAFSSDNTAAAERLKQARGKQQKEQTETEQQKLQAAQREEANTDLERQIAERKAGAVSYEEYKAMKKKTDETNILRKEIGKN